MVLSSKERQMNYRDRKLKIGLTQHQLFLTAEERVKVDKYIKRYRKSKDKKLSVSA